MLSRKCLRQLKVPHLKFEVINIHVSLKDIKDLMYFAVNSFPNCFWRLLTVLVAQSNILLNLTGLSDEEIEVYQDKGELFVSGHLLSGSDVKVSFSTRMQCTETKK